MRGEGFEPSRDVPGHSLQSLPGLRLAGFEPSDCTGFHASSRRVASAPHRSRLGKHQCEGRDSNRSQTCSLAPLAARDWQASNPPRTRMATHVRSSRRVYLTARFAHRSILRDASLRSASRYARGGIRTHGPLQERILSPPPLSELGHPRAAVSPGGLPMGVSIPGRSHDGLAARAVRGTPRYHSTDSVPSPSGSGAISSSVRLSTTWMTPRSFFAGQTSAARTL